jgi:hypothetical protein
MLGQIEGRNVALYRGDLLLWLVEVWVVQLTLVASKFSCRAMVLLVVNAASEVSDRDILLSCYCSVML